MYCTNRSMSNAPFSHVLLLPHPAQSQTQIRCDLQSLILLDVRDLSLQHFHVQPYLLFPEDYEEGVGYHYCHCLVGARQKGALLSSTCSPVKAEPSVHIHAILGFAFLDSCLEGLLDVVAHGGQILECLPEHHTCRFSCTGGKVDTE